VIPDLDPLRRLADEVADLRTRVNDLTKRISPPGLVMLRDIVLAAVATQFDFPNIPTTFRHLWVLAFLHTDRASQTRDYARMRINGSSGTVYDWMWYDARHETTTSVPVFSSVEGEDDTSFELGPVPGAAGLLNFFSPYEVYLPHYGILNNSKSYNARGSVFDGSGSEQMFSVQGTGRWNGNPVVSRLTLLPRYGTNFIAGCRATLFGLG